MYIKCIQLLALDGVMLLMDSHNCFLHFQWLPFSLKLLFSPGLLFSLPSVFNGEHMGTSVYTLLMFSLATVFTTQYFH